MAVLVSISIELYCSRADFLYIFIPCLAPNPKGWVFFTHLCEVIQAQIIPLLQNHEDLSKKSQHLG